MVQAETRCMVGFRGVCVHMLSRRRPSEGAIHQLREVPYHHLLHDITTTRPSQSERVMLGLSWTSQPQNGDAHTYTRSLR
ncbi:hypothetical protein AOLI_G00314760 [Acnodon oligacanthus]